MISIGRGESPRDSRDRQRARPRSRRRRSALSGSESSGEEAQALSDRRRRRLVYSMSDQILNDPGVNFKVGLNNHEIHKFCRLERRRRALQSPGTRRAVFKRHQPGTWTHQRPRVRPRLAAATRARRPPPVASQPGRTPNLWSRAWSWRCKRASR